MDLKAPKAITLPVLILSASAVRPGLSSHTATTPWPELPPCTRQDVSIAGIASVGGGVSAGRRRTEWRGSAARRLGDTRRRSMFLAVLAAALWLSERSAAVTAAPGTPCGTSHPARSGRPGRQRRHRKERSPRPSRCRSGGRAHSGGGGPRQRRPGRRAEVAHWRRQRGAARPALLELMRPGSATGLFVNTAIFLPSERIAEAKELVAGLLGGERFRSKKPGGAGGPRRIRRSDRRRPGDRPNRRPPALCAALCCRRCSPALWCWSASPNIRDTVIRRYIARLARLTRGAFSM